MLTSSEVEWFADLWLLTFLVIGLSDEWLSLRGEGLIVSNWRH